MHFWILYKGFPSSSKDAHTHTIAHSLRTQKAFNSLRKKKRRKKLGFKTAQAKTKAFVNWESIESIDSAKKNLDMNKTKTEFSQNKRISATLLLYY